MKVTVEHEVERCRDCPHSSNSSQEHDDPFTSAPYPTTWYCNEAKDGWGRRIIIEDAWKIDKRCPLKR